MARRKVRFAVASILYLFVMLFRLTSVLEYMAWYDVGEFVWASLGHFLVELVFCIVLFRRKRSCILCIGAAVKLLIDILYYPISVSTLLCVWIPDTLLFSLLLFAFLPTWKECTNCVRRVWFIPGVWFAVVWLFGDTQLITAAVDSILYGYSYHDVYLSISILLQGLFTVLSVFFLADWVTKPVVIEEIYYDMGAGCYAGTYGFCSLGKHILLLFFTFGIWNLIWIYRTTRILNAAPKCKQYSPGGQLLLCMFVPFYMIYWYYDHGRRVGILAQSKHLVQADISVLCLVMSLFNPFIVCVVLQDRINHCCLAEVESKWDIPRMDPKIELDAY